MGVNIITVSGKGQVVLPMEMRKKLGITEGGALAAFATDKVIVLKPVGMPTPEEFSGWLKDAQAWAKKAGYKDMDVAKAVKSVRKGKKK